jgi:hypothetical protein
MKPTVTYKLSDEDNEVTVTIVWNNEEHQITSTRRNVRDRISEEPGKKFIVLLDEQGKDGSAYTLNPDQKYRLVMELPSDPTSKYTMSWKGDAWLIEVSQTNSIWFIRITSRSQTVQ